MNLEIILALILIYYLRRPYVNTTISPQNKKILNWGRVLAISILILGLTGQVNDTLIRIISVAILGAMVYLALRFPEFSHRKYLVYAFVPLIVFSLVEGIFEYTYPVFLEEYEKYIDAANLFAVVWAIAMWYISLKQKKALELERQKAEAKEQEYRITQQLKDQLEIKVEERTAELTKQKEALENTLKELKATQNQLIHAEKMASLGELTAGIAHEIQNPLNFVNNFSEVTNELMVEMLEELENGDVTAVKGLVSDITQNLKKINEHGKRADSIVKGMLQHSRSSSGKMEPVDLNAIADEYLRLSYHGFRAKDRSFNATFKTDFDPNLPKVKAIPQDLGRVFLNLITNAFYALSKKAKLGEGLDSYSPEVNLSTRVVEGKIKIVVADNGPGIPPEIKDKIFQPFFTTKPTGEGTGLGLSLAYDIVKAHGGELKVETQEGEGTTFFIYLPIQ